MKYNKVASFCALGLILMFFICESSAAGCTQYGHSCWGGHGKRGIPDSVQQMRRLEENWFLSKLARSVQRGEPLPDLGLVFNRPPVNSKEIEMLKQIAEAKENFDNENDRRNYIRANSLDSDDAEEKPANGESIEDLLLMADNTGTPEKINLMKLLKNNIPSQK